MDKEATLEIINLFKTANEKLSSDIENNLLGRRFSEDTLKSTLQRLLGTKKVTLTSKTEDEYVGEEDYCVYFSSINGNGTIYYLKTRNQQMYVVKVNAYLIPEEYFNALELLKDLTTMEHISSGELDYMLIYNKICEYHNSGKLSYREYDFLLSEWIKRFFKKYEEN